MYIVFNNMMVTIVLLLLYTSILTISAHASERKEQYRVVNLPGLPSESNFKQYSGYLQAGKDIYLYYWLVESERSPTTSPLVLWLNGGPGCSSTTGLLEENGPFRVDPSGEKLIVNTYSWNKIANMLYIESPVGVGFSFSKSKNYTNDDNTTRDQTFLALKSFYDKFPEYVERDLYLTGESYAGVYVPMLADRVLNDTAFPLKGYAIGNGLLNAHLLDSSLLYFEYYHGIIGTRMWSQLLDVCCNGDSVSRCMFSVEAQSKPECKRLTAKAMELAWYGGVNVYGMYAECAGGAPLFSTVMSHSKSRHITRASLPHPGLMPRTLSGRREIMQKLKLAAESTNDTEVAYTPCTDNSHIDKWLSNKQVQRALHVEDSNVSYHSSCSDTVSARYTKLVFDLTAEVQRALDRNVHVLIYNGDTDMACNFLGDEWFVESLGRKQLQDYRPWLYKDELGNDQIAGYARQFEGITFATVKGSGHFVPKDKPREAFEMFDRFLQDTPL